VGEGGGGGGGGGGGILKMRIEVLYTPTRSPRQIDANFIYKKTARSSQKQPEAARGS
jgi:hypothetical protein